MSKFAQNGKSLAIVLQPRSPEQAREVARLRRELGHIAILTTSGGIADLTKLLWNMTIEKCKERASPFMAADEAASHLADAYEREVERRFKQMRR